MLARTDDIYNNNNASKKQYNFSNVLIAYLKWNRKISSPTKII